MTLTVASQIDSMSLAQSVRPGTPLSVPAVTAQQSQHTRSNVLRMRESWTSKRRPTYEIATGKRLATGEGMRLFSLVALALLQMGLASTCYAEKVDRPFEKYIRVGHGEVVRASGPVARMDTVLKYSYEYRRTGVLKEDLKGNGLGKIYAPAGAKGFVITELGTSAETMSPLWCFRAADLPKYEATCTISGYVFEHVKSRLIASIETTDYTPRIVPAVIEDGPIDASPMQLEIKFVSWTAKEPTFQFFIDGELQRAFRVTPDKEGAAILETIAGAVRLTRTGTTVTASPIEAQQSAQAQANPLAVVESAFEVKAAADETEFAEIKRGTTVLTQAVTPGAPYRQLTSPMNSPEKTGDAGALLFPAMRGQFPIWCWRPETPKFDSFMSRWVGQCLEDTNADGAADTVWLWVTPVNAKSFFVGDVAGPRKLSPPVKIEPAAPLPDMPSAELSIVYIGPVADKRAEDGSVRVAAVEFEWFIDKQPTHRRFGVAIDDAGEGKVSTSTGEMIGALRAVKTDGSAQFKLVSGLPTGKPLFMSGRN